MRFLIHKLLDLFAINTLERRWKTVRRLLIRWSIGRLKITLSKWVLLLNLPSSTWFINLLQIMRCRLKFLVLLYSTCNINSCSMFHLRCIDLIKVKCLKTPKVAEFRRRRDSRRSFNWVFISLMTLAYCWQLRYKWLHYVLGLWSPQLLPFLKEVIIIHKYLTLIKGHSWGSYH